VAAARRFHRSDALADDLAILLLHARTVAPTCP
jgi:hypothetical protein